MTAALTLAEISGLLREMWPHRTVFCAADQLEELQAAVDAMNVPRIKVVSHPTVLHGQAIVVNHDAMSSVLDSWWPISDIAKDLVEKGTPTPAQFREPI